MKKLLKTISIVLIIANLLLIPFSAYAATGTNSTTSDNALLSKWKGYGLLDKSITNSDLNKPIQKIDFIRYINELLKPSQLVDIGFNDVPKDSWYGAEIAKAVASGYVINQDKTNYSPFTNITRLDASIMIAHVFGLELQDKNLLNKITDAEKLDAEQLATFGAVVEKGYLSEISSGRYAPSGVLKLTDALQMLDKCIGQLVTKASTITSDVSGNMLINTGSVTLKNITVNGDLIIGEGVANGDVNLQSVKIKGRLIIRGGGPNSVNLVNTQIIGNLIVEKSAGDVHIELSGTSTIEQTNLKSGGSLTEKKLTSGKGFVNVTADRAVIDNQTANLQGDFNNIMVVDSNINVKLNGNAENINVSKASEGSVSVNGNVKTISTQASKNTLELLSGTISALNVETGAKGNKITINGATATVINIKENTAVNFDKGTVEKLTIESTAEGSNLKLKDGAILKSFYANAGTTVDGQGKIFNAYVYSNNVSMGIKPSGTYLAYGSATNIDGSFVNPSLPSISINSFDITRQVGVTEKVPAYVYPNDSTLSYSSSDKAIATVDEKGMLTTNAVGTTSVHISASKAGYNPNVKTIKVTVTSDNITAPGTLTISPETEEVGSTRNFTLTYTAGDDMLNGKVIIKLPGGFPVLASDTVTIGKSTEQALGSSQIQDTQTLVFANLNLTQNEAIVVKLKNKLVPVGGQYEFSSTTDADDAGPKLSTSDGRAIFTSDSLRILKETINYSIPEYGATAGTTKISTLSFDGIAGYIAGTYKWLIKVQSGAFTKPEFNDVLLATEYIEYTGQDIPVIAGQTLRLAAVDTTGGTYKIKAYADITITNGVNADGIPNNTAKMIRPDDAGKLELGINYTTPEKGVQAGTVRIGVINNYAGAANWMIKVQDTPLSTVFVNTPFVGVTDYLGGEDIKVNANQHIILAAVDSHDNILAYSDLTVTSDMVSKPAGVLLPDNNFEAPSYGSEEGTTQIKWMNNGGFTEIKKWMIVTLSKDAVIPSNNATTKAYEKYYAEGKTFSEYIEKTNIAVALGQHLLLVGVTDADVIQAYADIIIGTNAVRQANAPKIPNTDFKTPVMGSTEYTTMIPTLNFSTAILGATKYMVKVQNDGIAAPQLNSTLQGAIDCVAKQDINITAGQHLILIATDGAGKIKAYEDILVGDVDQTQIRPKDALKLTVVDNDYLLPAPGTIDGSTMIVLKSNRLPRVLKKWMYKVQDAQFATPYDGSSIPGGMTEYTEYTSGTDITKEFISAGQHILIVAVDTDDKIMAYIEEIITPKQIKQAKAKVIPDSNCSTPVVGLLKDTTRIMSMNFQGIYGATQWLYQISKTEIAAPDYDSIISGKVYHYDTVLGGESIAITKDWYIVLYAVDSKNKVKEYKNIQVKDNQIKIEVPTLNVDTGYTNYVAPTLGSAPGTTKISTLSILGIAGQAPLRWEYAIGNKAFIAPAINTTLSAIGVTTKGYVLNTDTDNIKSGQFILLLAVDGNNVIQGYANIQVQQNQIKPDAADKILTSNYSLVQGAAEGTTRFGILNRVGLSDEATKWMIKTQPNSFDTTTIGKDIKVLGSYYYDGTLNPMKDIPIWEDQHILLLATDGSGYVKAFVDIEVAKEQIKNPFAMELVLLKNYTDPQPGTSPGAISITLKTTDIPTDDTIVWKYIMGGTTALAKPHLDDVADLDYHAYESNDNILFVANNYIMVVAVNKSDSKIKAYAQFKITESQIKPANATKLVPGVGNNYTAPVPGSQPGTTKIGGLSFIGLSGDVDHWVIKVVDSDQTIDLNSSILYPTSVNYTGGNISVKKDQYVVLAAVDTNNRVKAYANIKVEDYQINPSLATGIIKYSTPKYGSKEGTTAIYLLKEGIADFKKFMLWVVSSPQDIIAGKEISAGSTTGSDYSSFRSYDESTGADITATEGQYLLIVAVDSSNKALAYVNIPLKIEHIRPGNATLLTSPKNYLELKPGAGVGTTLISGLDAFDIPGFSKWVVKVDNSAPAIPLMNSSVNYVDDYTVNEEIKVTQGQVVQLYALDASGYVKGYAFIPVGQDDVKGVAPRLYPVPVPGTNLNTTKLVTTEMTTLLTSITGATKWQYAVLDSAPADILKDSQLTYVSGYTGTEILAAEGKHLVLVATDNDGYVKAYADIILTDKMLKGINAAISGTIIDSTGESDIVFGGRTIIITLDSGEWQDDIFTDPIKLKLLFNGFTPTVTDTQWKNVVAGFNIVPMNPVDKKVITIRLSECIYDITKNQQINLKIDRSLIKNAVKDVIVSAFTIGADAIIKPLTGTAIIPGLTKDNIITGGKTIIVELSVGEFATDIDTNVAKREAIFDGITTLNPVKTVRDQIVANLKSAGSNAIKWNSKTKITITLPAISDFNLDNNEVLSLTIPCKTSGKEEILVGAVKGAVAPTQIIISDDVAVTLSGTLLSSSTTESNIVTGGKTLTITLNHGQWVTDIATDKTKREALFLGISVSPVVSTTETAQWTKVISALNAAALIAGQTTIIRDNDNTTVTIELPAVSGYNITADQTITVNIPVSSIIGAKNTLIAGQNAVIEREATAVLTGSVGGSTEANIKTGGKTIVITLKDATWVNDVGTTKVIKDALLDGLVADVDNDAWKLVVEKLKSTSGSVQKTSATVATITLPSVDTYNITENDTISITVATCAAIGIPSVIKATGTLAITDTVTPVIVTKVNAVTPNTSYKIGDTVDINVTFDNAVEVTGTGKPYINLETGSTDRTATYANASSLGDNVLTFKYTVQAGDTSQILDYKAGSIALPAGTSIVNAGTTTAVNKALPTPGTAGSLLESKIYIDGIVPVLATGYPKVGTITEKEADLLVKIDDVAKIYYVVVPYNVSNVTPSVDQIMNNTTTLTVVANGTIDAAILNTEYTEALTTGLLEYTKYTVYMFAEDIIPGQSIGNTTIVTSFSFTTKDITPPKFVLGKEPVQGTISDNKIDILMTLDEDATVYMIALPKDSTAPTSTQVTEFKDASGNVVSDTKLKLKMDDVPKGIYTTISFTGLSVSSHYDIYIVGMDMFNNKFVDPASVLDAQTSKLVLDNVGVNVAQKLITNTTAAMQYSYDGYTWSDCGAAQNTTLEYNDATDYLTIYVREKANTTNIRSLPIISRGTSVIDIAKIDYDILAKKITNTNTVSSTDVLALEYRMNGGTWNALNASATNVDFEAGYFEVRTAATVANLPSIPKTVVNLPLPMLAPDLDCDDYLNTITGLESTYEYMIDSGDWVNGSVEGDFTGTKKVQVRKLATKEKLASNIMTVNFTACAIKVVASPATASDTLNTAYVKITFEENTNKQTITAKNLRDYFLVGKWVDTDNDPDTEPVLIPSIWDTDTDTDINSITWNSVGNILTIAYKAMTVTTVIIGDEVRIDAGAGIKKAGAPTSSASYTSKGTLTGSFHTVPKLSVKAFNSGDINYFGFGDGDKIVITFDQATNKKAITAANIANYLILTDLTGKQLDWNTESDLTNLTVGWNTNSDKELTIVFNKVASTELTIKSKITVDPSWGLKDAAQTTAVCNSSTLIDGSFSSIPTIKSAVYAAGKVTITFDQATNTSTIPPYQLNHWLKLVGTDGTNDSWGIKNDQVISWSSDKKVLTITFNSTEGRTIVVNDTTLTLDTLAEVKDINNSTAASTASCKITDH